VKKNAVYLLYVPRRFNIKKFTFRQQSAIFCVMLMSEQKVIFPAKLTDLNSLDRKCVQRSNS